MFTDQEALELLSVYTYAHEHSPNCKKQHLVRIIAARQVRLDKKSYGALHFAPCETNDLCGFGTTFGEAAAEALYLKELSEIEFRKTYNIKAA